MTSDKSLNYGTSEGAIAGWDTRGRGKKEEETKQESSPLETITKETERKLNRESLKIQGNESKALQDFSSEASLSSTYPNSLYSAINRHLAGKESLDNLSKEDRIKVEETLKVLDNIMNKSSLPEDLTTYSNSKLVVYSGLGKTATERVSNAKPGDTIEWEPFMSTTPSLDKADNFRGKGDTLLEIRLPKGSKAIWMDGHSKYPEEKELLINRGSSFKVVNERYQDKSRGILGKDKYRILTIELVQSKSQDQKSLNQGIEDEEDFLDELEEEFYDNNLAIWAAVWALAAKNAFKKGEKVIAADLMKQVKGNAKMESQIAKALLGWKNRSDLFFEEHGLELVKGMTETDLGFIKMALKGEWENKDGFLKAIQDSGLMSEGRASKIFVTETQAAQEEGKLSFAQDAGAVMKEWQAYPGCCDTCDQLNGEMQNIEDPFSNGEMRPPEHPNCLCFLTYYREGGKEGELPEMYFEKEEDEAPKLENYGVEGMKWGIRKGEEEKEKDSLVKEKILNDYNKSNPLTKLQKDTIINYTIEDSQDTDFDSNKSYYAINRWLNKDVDPKEYPPVVRDSVRIMTLALKKSELPENIVTYRGLATTNLHFSNKEKILDIYKEGRVTMENGFISTTIDKDKGIEYAAHNTLLEISCPKGTNGRFLGEGMTDTPDDKEILLQRGTIFHTTGIREEEYKGEKITIISQEVVR